MASQVEICNIALSHLGVNAINSFDETTREASTCRLHYDTTRKAVLRDHAWGFAKKRVTLALETFTISGWDYAYAYPADCITANQIYNATTPDTIEFETSVNDDLDEIIILTNQEAAELIYTADVIVDSIFDPIFVKAFALTLGVNMVQALKADSALKSSLEDQAIRVLNRAKAVNANEVFRKADNSNNTFLSSRG